MIDAKSSGYTRILREDQTDVEAANGDGSIGDRDERYFAVTRQKGNLVRDLAPWSNSKGGCRDKNWGGSMRRMTDMGLAPSREDVAAFVSVPGRYVPVGFARYEPPTVNPGLYEYYRAAGWRVAVPRSLPSRKVRDLLHRIYQYGPQSAGYVRNGDTLVPAILESGDRVTVAQAAIESYPLTL